MLLYGFNADVRDSSVVTIAHMTRLGTPPNCRWMWDPQRICRWASSMRCGRARPPAPPAAATAAAATCSAVRRLSFTAHCLCLVSTVHCGHATIDSSTKQSSLLACALFCHHSFAVAVADGHTNPHRRVQIGRRRAKLGWPQRQPAAGGNVGHRHEPPKVRSLCRPWPRAGARPSSCSRSRARHGCAYCCRHRRAAGG